MTRIPEEEAAARGVGLPPPAAMHEMSVQALADSAAGRLRPAIG
ncbi:MULTISPECIES: hypothetical protein [Nonomuraea]|uniref:Uncharacterized protein n=1 Tax=Nonomuraea mangrovi TaxID=2316207 RepID=A0ABW4TEA4_9ACTN